MAAPGPRKRSGPALCGAGWVRGPAPAAPLGNGVPPHKRPKGPAAGGGEAPEDPFGDGDDFTADELEEIETLASQALSQDAGRGWGGRAGPRGRAAGQEPAAGGGADTGLPRDAFRYEVLQTQHEEIRHKLKEMQDEILTKNGEIKILRDSMQQMECAMEEQKKSYMLLEQQKSQTLKEKEKEFSKKILSLQSELQFKDAEMNELRTRLQNCERNKHVTQTVLTPSPKKNSAIQVKSEGCSPQSGRRSFPTKESFGADTSTRPSSSRKLFAQAASIKEDSKIPHPEVLSMKNETEGKNGSYKSVHKRNTQGSILLNALMKQPIVPGSLLGLCHLLSSNSETLQGAMLQSNLLDTKPTQIPSIRTTQEEIAPLVSLREAQKLAITGLNLIAMDEGSAEGSLAGSGREFLPLKRCKIRGAVHLLPLVEHHIGAYCQAVQLADKAVNGSCGNHSVVSSRTSTNMVSSKEDFRSSLEETTVISLGILYYLAFYSWDVVHILLSTEVEEGSTVGDEQISKMDKDVLCDNKEDTRTQGGLPEASQDVPINDRAQHSLFRKLIQVLDFSTTTGSQTDNILKQSLKVLVKLAENSTVDLLINFQHLLSSQILLRCLCPEIPLHAVLLTVKLLCILAQHHMLVAQLCSHSDTCLLLALYMYITSRPDKSASEVLWLQLEQETVRLLTKCTRCSRPAILLPGTDCQCNPEVVKALIVMLHRQWMKMRRSDSGLCAHKEQIIQFLRDAVLLLHSLSQKDKLFHEHCLEVLHQYDQAMPGIRAILKKNQKLSACEELMLDELYPPEPEAEDQGMDCS
ncbi:ATR-interacting protein isoform X1 [Anas platyrhynchos]|uniref:ATR-interacting protein isoform X1 n=1 Tax=Anas platyrhynchos TaxID=8839 RepID=UPI000F7C457B|nr:ATR-interacting protein isoform X1 [Anas platyrhynchos]|eukprot:XP_027323527.1 ATR-interacting protein isoform X1 [Anas platyrhynchos]